jgi:hypothetical protein
LIEDILDGNVYISKERINPLKNLLLKIYKKTMMMDAI